MQSYSLIVTYKYVLVVCSSATHEDDEYENLKVKEAQNYYSLAHTVKEEVEQASMMVNGTLKEYQVKEL